MSKAIVFPSGLTSSEIQLPTFVVQVEVRVGRSCKPSIMGSRAWAGAPPPRWAAALTGPNEAMNSRPKASIRAATDVM